MHPKIILPLVLSMPVLISLACSFGAPAATPDTQATINAAVAATHQAQATLDAAVKATDIAQAAQQATVDAAAQATATAQPINQATPTPTATSPTVAKYSGLTEAELSALIDQTVSAAITVAQQSNAAIADAVADNTITPQEVQSIQVYVTGANETVAQAQEQVAVYTDLYGDLAAESAAALEEINQSLQTVANSAAAMNETLTEINNTLAQGTALAQETITQLQQTAQTVNSQAAQIQAQQQVWTAAHQPKTGEQKPAIQPNQIAADPAGAMQSAFAFIEAGKQALADNQLSPNEVVSLGQLGANAQASLQTQDNIQLQQLSGMVNNITNQLNQGNLSQAQESFNKLGSALDSLPAIDKPAIDKPAKPPRPTRP